MAKKTATATAIKKDPIYAYSVARGEKILVINAESYRSFGDNDELIDFHLGDDTVASFKNWDYIIRGKEVISSSAS